jgi:hypothetical protein
MFRCALLKYYCLVIRCSVSYGAACESAVESSDIERVVREIEVRMT